MPRLIGVALMLACVARPLSAQTRVELEPVFGMYTGFSDWSRPQTNEPFIYPTTFSQRTAVALGGQATIWPSRRAGVRVTVITAASAIASVIPLPLFTAPEDARVTTAGAEVLVRLAELASGGGVFAAGGPLIVRRSGNAYEGFAGTTDLGGSLGLGSQFRLTDRLRLQADLRTLLYRLQLTDPDGLQYPSSFQTDLQAHVGLSLELSTPSDD